MELEELNWLKLGPYQMQLQKVSFFIRTHIQRFQSNLFNMFLSWIKYFPINEAYYLTYNLFSSKLVVVLGQMCFLNKVLDNKKRLIQEKCVFLNHIVDSPFLLYNNTVKACEDCWINLCTLITLWMLKVQVNLQESFMTQNLY